MENTFLNYALLYASAGFRVFPLLQGNKKPLPRSSGYKEATTDTEKIRKWWEDNPKYNIGIATGKTENGKYITVIDLDINEEKKKNGLAECEKWQSDNKKPFPTTLTARTGRGGMHLYYISDEEYRCTTNLLPGVDVRGEGGYIVAPPSIHPNGTAYSWTDETFTIEKISQSDSNIDCFLKQERQKAANDQLFLRQPKGTKKPTSLPLNTLDTFISGLNFVIGSRNDSLFRLTAHLQARGYADSDIVEIVRRINREKCSLPVEEKELDSIIKSVIERYPKGIPRSIEATGNFALYTERIEKKYPFIIPKHNGNGEITYSVSTQRLASYIREKEHYFFLDTHGEKPLVFIYSRGCYRQCSDNDFKGRIKAHIKEFSEELIRTKDLDEVFKLLLTDGRTVTSDQLDDCENLINFENGLLNIDTLVLSEHSPEVYSTIQIPCSWNNKAGNCTQFAAYLDTLANGDSETKVFLWQYIGLIISNIPAYTSKSALFLCGAGNTGKSQLLELMAKLVGSENYSSIDLQELEQRFGTGHIWRKRLVGAPDMSYQKIDEMKVFKKLTGGDRITFEYKGKDKFTDTYKGALLFCCNDLPKFGGDKGEHVYKRMVIIPCDNVIPEEKQDRQLIKKLYAEREGIVYNAVMALKTYVDSGKKFAIPQKCSELREQYKVQNDNVLQFLEECTQPREVDMPNKSKITAAVVYDIYKNWAKSNGEYMHKKSDFCRSIQTKYNAPSVSAIKIKVQGFYCFKDFTVTSEAIDRYLY